MKYFGTDGIRSKVNSSFLDQNFAVNLGEAVAKFIKSKSSRNNKVFIGRDTRPSGEMLLNGFMQGLKNEDLSGISVGVLPTPALAFCVIKNKGALGVQITASHNPECDNGFKFFLPSGNKLTENEESLIEELISTDKKQLFPQSIDSINADTLYIQYVLSLFPKNLLSGLKIVADLSYGATKNTSPKILSALGAEVISIHDGNGKINDCVGSEHPEIMASRTSLEKADFGIAHDGDGDRVIFADSDGKIIKGDKILGLLAIHEKSMHRLNNNNFVATIHSNSGLAASLKKFGITLSVSDVGDKKVAQMMRKQNSNFGGESSGHIVASDFLPTGDGLITAILVARAIIETKKKLNDLIDQIVLWPSLEGSFLIKEKIPIENCEPLKLILDENNNKLRNKGRILLRYSGTEPKIRLLVEATENSTAEAVYNSLAKTIKSTL